MDESEKIKIILEEYKTLRSEILQRHGSIVRIYTVGGTAFLAVLGFAAYNGTIMGGLLMTVALVLLVVGATLIHEQNVRSIAARLLEIEDDINRRAGDRLLKWEHTSGILSVDLDQRTRRIWRRLKSQLVGN